MKSIRQFFRRQKAVAEAQAVELKPQTFSSTMAFMDEDEDNGYWDEDEDYWDDDEDDDDDDDYWDDEDEDWD